MSSLRNAVHRRAHKERAQPNERKRFGLLEKHKDYLVRAKAFHKKQDYIQVLKEKAALRNPEEFYFSMINSKTVNGVHKQAGEANKYSEEELLLMKSQDIGYILQKILSEKKKIERLTATLHSLDSQPSNRHVYYAEDREDAKKIMSTKSVGGLPTFENLPDKIKRRTASSYRELEAKKSRLQDLEKVYNEMALKQELRKKGKKRKLREEEIVCPTSRPVYKWRTERKR